MIVVFPNGVVRADVEFYLAGAHGKDQDEIVWFLAEALDTLSGYRGSGIGPDGTSAHGMEIEAALLDLGATP